MKARIVPVAALLAGAVACGGASPPAQPVASRTSAPAPQAPEREAAVPEAKPKIAPGVSARWVVYDRTAGKVTSQRSSHLTVRSASIVKLFIALDYLEKRRGKVASSDARAFGRMLRSSDDKAATRFWNLGGKGKIVQRVRAKLKLTDSAPPPASKPGFWGYTAISAMDIAKTYRYILEKATPATRNVIMGHLRKSTPCGSDGFDQNFGIPASGAKPWSAKQGWSGFGLTPPYPCRATRYTNAAGPDLGLGRPVLHTTGTIGRDDRYIVVILTLNPVGASYKTSVQRLTTLTRSLVR